MIMLLINILLILETDNKQYIRKVLTKNDLNKINSAIKLFNDSKLNKCSVEELKKLIGVINHNIESNIENYYV